MTKRLLSVLLGLGCLAAAQAPSVVQGTPPPTYILYRLLFRHLMALEAQADALDASAQAGGASLRSAFQNELGLTGADAAVVMVVAGTCVQQLDVEDAKARAAISTAKAAVAAAVPAQQSTLTAAAITQLNTLETERTAISNSCIQNLQRNLSARTFARIDLYVSSTIGSKTHPVPIASTPATPAGQAAKQ